MSFAGSVIDMIRRSNYNRAQQKGIRENFDKAKNFILQSHTSHTPLKNKDFDPVALERCKAEIRQKAKRETKRETVILTAIILSIMFLTGLAMAWWS